MSCIKNPKKWLWFKYQGDHVNRMLSLSKFMPTSDCFIIEWECELCGCKENEHFVSWNDLLHIGLTNDQIKKVDNETILTFTLPVG